MPRRSKFFENKIRPVLVEQLLQAPLRRRRRREEAQRRAEARHQGRVGSKGGDTGRDRAREAWRGKRFVKSLQYDGDVQMPPKGKLPDAGDRGLREVDRGRRGRSAHRRSSRSVATGIDIEKGEQFWSFQPVKEPSVPQIRKPQSRQPATQSIPSLAAKWAEKGPTPVTIAEKPHAHPPGVLRPHRPAAHAGERSRRSSRTKSPDAFAKLIDTAARQPAPRREVGAGTGCDVRALRRRPGAHVRR